MSKAITKTKLICTIGPASNDEATIRKMIENGMNVARLNFSHGTHESHRATIQLVRKIAKEMGVNIGFLQDLCGPKIRLGKLSLRVCISCICFHLICFSFPSQMFICFASLILPMNDTTRSFSIPSDLLHLTFSL